MDSLNYYYTYYEYPQPSTAMPPQPYYGYQLQPPPPPQFNYQPPAAIPVYSVQDVAPPQYEHVQHLEQPKHNRRQRRRGKRFHGSAPYSISQPTPSTSNFQSQQAVELIDLTLPSEFENTHESTKTSNESADASQSAPEVSYFIEKDEFCKIFKKNGNIILLCDPEALKRHLKMYDALVAIKRGEETKVECQNETPEITNEADESK